MFQADPLPKIFGWLVKPGPSTIAGVTDYARVTGDANPSLTRLEDLQTQLEALAGLVIDLYKNADQVFEPELEDDLEAIIYLTDSEPGAHQPDAPASPRPKLNYWYTRADSLKDRK